MTISSHPDIATLMTCSAGSTPEALCAVVTSHLSMCPICLEELRSMEVIGVVLFEELQPVKTDANAPNIGATETEDRLGGDAASADADVPSPLVEVIGSNLDSLAWQQLALGIWNFTIPMTAQLKGDLRLIKLDPGSKLPEHWHKGEELILVLRGSYRNATGAFKPGDFAELDDENKSPMIAEQDGCILLIGNDAMPAFIAQLN